MVVTVFPIMISIFPTFYLIAQCSSSFSESLHLNQYADGKVFAEFKFVTSINSSFDHYSILPKAIGEIVSTYRIQELQLHFTQGRWQHDRWGVQSAHPAGALLAWIQESPSNVSYTVSEENGNHKGLKNALAGLFCSSLNFMTESITSSPSLVLQSSGAGKVPMNYALLPREAVCTENLTPWSKLLPCQTKAGLASLLHGHKLFDSAYQSMGVTWSPLCLVSHHI